ncbi:MAG: sigma-70 family RNA polymerase sigma factor [Pseudomonadota bacterium]
MARNLRVISGGRAAGASAPAGVSSGGAEAGTMTAQVGLRELYGKYGGTVYGRCHYLLKDAAKAEDAMQDVFAKALINMAGFRAEASPLTWLTKIATNHCLNLLRSDRAAWHRTYEDEELARAARAQQTGVASGPRLFEDREAVRKLLEKVDLETQAAAIHYYVDEMTLEEVAAALGRSVPTIRKRLETFAAQGGVEPVR